jgi:hypothetical protein
MAAVVLRIIPLNVAERLLFRSIISVVKSVDTFAQFDGRANGPHDKNCSIARQEK